MFVILRLLSLVLVVAALLLLGADAITSLENGGKIVVRSLDQVWTTFDKQSVEAFHAWLGRGEVLRPMQEAWAAGDRRRALELIPDEVVDELVVHGSLDACRERVAEYHATGLDTPVIMVVPMPGVDEVAAVRGLASVS